MIKSKILSVVLALGMIMQTGAVCSYAADTTVETKNLYVKPTGNDDNTGTSNLQALATLKQAYINAGKWMNDGYNVVINLDGSEEGVTYYLGDNVNFSSSKLGSNDELSLTIQPKDAGEKVIISGGEVLSGFTLLEGTTDVYKTSYPSSTIQRQLYVNGTPATRARSTAETLPFTVVTNSSGNATAVTTTNTDVANWSNINKAELVFKASFVSPRKFITGVSVADGVATFSLNGGMTGLEGQQKITGNLGAVLHLENALEVLDEPGEWCHDGDYIYYKLRAGEAIDSIDVVLPKLASPVSFTGTSANPLKNVTVKNITFAHNTWLYPSTNGELIEMQSNVLDASKDANEIPGLVNTKYAQNIEFNGCIFTNGGGSGVDILTGSKNVRLTGCTISNISSAGILIGSVKSGGLGTDEASIVENITVEQSLIDTCAIDYRSAPGIAVGYTRDVKIVHNNIKNLPYTGIHIGWGWNYGSGSRLVEGVKIKYNQIEDCMQELHDGGCVYTLGATYQEAGLAGERNEIAYNYLKDIKTRDSAYLYHDNGSSYWSTHHNVIYHTGTENRAWVNTAPDTHDISIHYNFTNNSYETTISRVDDTLLEDMLTKTTVVYGMNDNGKPALNGYVLDCADYVIKNAGRNSTVLYDISDVKDTITLDKAVFVNEDVFLRDGGSAEIDTAMAGGALNFKLYAGDNTTGSYEITIDDKYRFVITTSGITMYENGVEKAANNDCVGWSADGYTDVTLVMTDTAVKFDYGNLPRIYSAATITEGKVKIKANGMTAMIGALPKHYTLTADDLKLYGGDVNKTVVSNGYFETDTTGWTGNYATLTRDTANTYGDSLGSLKVAETQTGTSAAATTTVSLSSGKWYRVSAMIKLDNQTNANSRTVKFTSNPSSTSLSGVYLNHDPSSGNYSTPYTSFFGKKFTLGSGWNKITDYIMLDSAATATIGIVVEPTSGSATDTYYVDNFEVVEEMPTLTESGFENGMGCWQRFGSPGVSITDNGYNGGKALTIDGSSVPFYEHAVRPIHLEEGKSYKARAKIYLESVTDGSTSNIPIMFSVHQYINYVNQTDMYGYQLKNISTGAWVDYEFTFTWHASMKNAPAFLKVIAVGKRAKLRIDDVEISLIPEAKIRTENADFTSRMNGWEYSGISALEFTTGEGVKITPSSSAATVYQQINMLKGMDYYAEGFVKLAEADNDNYTLANIVVTDDAGDATMTATGFSREGNDCTSVKQVISSDKWTKIGGIIRLDATAIRTPATLSLEVVNDDGTVPAYSVKGLRLIPVTDLTTTLSNVAITDGAVTYTGTGATGTKVRYTYYTYNNGWTKSQSGSVNMGGALPSIGDGKAYALITTTAANEADEVTEIAEATELTLLTATKADDKVNIKVAANNPQNKSLIVGVYSGDGQILKDCVFSGGEYQNTDITLDDASSAVEVKAFIWNMDLIKPLCDALSTVAN